MSKLTNAFDKHLSIKLSLEDGELVLRTTSLVEGLELLRGKLPKEIGDYLIDEGEDALKRENKTLIATGSYLRALDEPGVSPV